ncbi:kinase-like domain-containing protein [Fusarium oxysporum]|nr:kinase-like domain-containing protein [Fusarium oxysporum]
MPLRPHIGLGFPAHAYQKRHVEPHDRSTGYQPKVRITDRYRIIGFISSGTYGRVYKAVGRNGKPVGEFAIKKFKPDKEGEQISYTGISQSAIREMSLCSELHHINVIRLCEIMLEDKCIFMVFEYAEHDLLQIIHHHTQQPRHPIPPATIKSIMFQLLNGCQYLHINWVLHRDLKPANIMVTSSGEVKIGDLGLARRFDKPLHSLFSGDKVVVTIWYRAPELILGSYHYTPAIDMWAVGCIFAELLSLRPIFKGEEAKMDSKKTVPFQRNQMQKIIEIMGVPTKDKWPLLPTMPEYNQLNTLANSMASSHHGHHSHHHPHHHHGHYGSRNPPPPPPGGSNLEKWYYSTINHTSAPGGTPPLASLGSEGYKLLAGLLEYDPSKRLTAAQALQSPFFSTGDRPSGYEAEWITGRLVDKACQEAEGVGFQGGKRPCPTNCSSFGRSPTDHSASTNYSPSDGLLPDYSPILMSLYTVKVDGPSWEGQRVVVLTFTFLNGIQQAVSRSALYQS